MSVGIVRKEGRGEIVILEFLGKHSGICLRVE